jgi:hypothetical protein
MKQTVLLPEWLVALASMSVRGLEGHVGVRDLGDSRKEEDDAQEADEAGDGEVHPLDVLQGALIIEGEEDVGTQYRSNDCTDAVEGLRDVDAEFGVPRRTADCTSGQQRDLDRAAST